MKTKTKLKKYVKLWGKCFIPSDRRGEVVKYNIGIICRPDSDYDVDENGLTFEMMGRRIRVFNCETGVIGNYRLDCIRKYDEYTWKRQNNITES